MLAFNLAVVLELLAIAACLSVGLRYWKSIPGSARLFVVQAALALLMEVFGRITGMLGIHNQVFFNGYSVLEFATILIAARDFFGRGFVQVAIGSGLVFASVFAYDLAHTGPFYAAFHAFTAAWIILGTIYLTILVRSVFLPDGRALQPLVILSVTLFGYYFLTVPRFSLLRFIQESLTHGATVSFGALTAGFGCMRYLGTAIALRALARSSRGIAGQDAVPRPTIPLD